MGTQGESRALASIRRAYTVGYSEEASASDGSREKEETYLPVGRIVARRRVSCQPGVVGR